MSRRTGALSCLLSRTWRSQAGRLCGWRETAPATTGPARGPRPTSSTPATMEWPSAQSWSSRLRLGRRARGGADTRLAGREREARARVSGDAGCAVRVRGGWKGAGGEGGVGTMRAPPVARQGRRAFVAKWIVVGAPGRRQRRLPNAHPAGRPGRIVSRAAARGRGRRIGRICGKLRGKRRVQSQPISARCPAILPNELHCCPAGRGLEEGAPWAGLAGREIRLSTC